MRRFIWAAAIALGVLASRCAHTRQAPIALVPVEVHGGIVFVPTMIGDHGPYWFELDSGFQNCAIDQGLASRLGLDVAERQRIDAPGGTVERATIRGARLRVGGLDVPDAAISAIDLSPFGPFFGRAPDGILGYDLFHAYVVRIDYEHRVLALLEPGRFELPRDGISVPIDTTLRQPYVTAAVVTADGAKATGRFEIDTGSMDALNLNTPFADANAILSRTAGTFSARGRSIGGETDARLTRVAALQIGDLRIPDPVASIVNDEVDRAGQISAETLRRFTVTFDYWRGIVHLAANRQFSAPFEFDMAGWFIVASGPDLAQRQVFVVLEGSPAAAAGVKEGDLLLSIDGGDAQTIPLDDIRALFKEPGKTFTVTLRRNGSVLSATITTKRLL